MYKLAKSVGGGGGAILLTECREISDRKYMLTSVWPHHPEHVLFHLISEAKQHWAQLVLGWETGNTESRCCRLLAKGHEDDEGIRVSVI